jgi:hypothetical protein
MSNYDSYEQQVCSLKIPYPDDADYKTSFSQKKKLMPRKGAKIFGMEMKTKEEIMKNPKHVLFQEIPFEFRTDKEFILQFVTMNDSFGVFYIFLPQSMREDEEVCIQSIQHCNINYYEYDNFIHFIPKKLLNNSKVCEELLKSKISQPMLTLIPTKFQTKEIIKIYLKNRPEDYREIPDSLKSDEEIFLLCLQRNEHSYIHFNNKKLKEDREFNHKVTVMNPKVYQYTKDKFNVEYLKKLFLEVNYKLIVDQIPESLLLEKEFYYSLVKKFPFMISKMPQAFQKDAKIIKELSTSQTWADLPSVCYETLMKKDEEFILKLIEKEPILFRIMKPLHVNQKLIKFAIEKDPEFFGNISSIPKDILLDYLNNNPTKYKSLSYRLKDTFKNDKDFFVYKLVDDPSQFKDFTNYTKDELKIYLSISGVCIYWTGQEYKSDRELVLIAVKSSGEALEFVNSSFYSDKEVVITAVSSYGRALSFADEELKDDFEIVMEAVRNNGTAVKFASKRLKKNPKICLAAIEQSRTAYRDLDPSMKTQLDVWLVYTKRYQKLQPNSQAKLKDIHFNFCN